MVEERRPAKKVVKKVVKKTVVRPAPIRSPQNRSAQIRSAQNRSAQNRPAQTGTTKVRPAASSSTASTSPIAKLKAKSGTPRRRPSIRIPSPPRRPGAGLAERARLVGSRVRERAGDASYTTGRSVRRSLRWVRDLRLPHLSPLRGAAVTGVIVGLLAVVLGWLSGELFSATRGTSNGGAWAALALVVVAFLTYAVGELLLEGFGLQHARVISATSILLLLVLVLTFFLSIAAGIGAWILLPVLGAVTFMASSYVMRLAADQPNLR